MTRTHVTRFRSRTVVAPAAGTAFLLTAVLMDFVSDLQFSGAYAAASVLASISSRARATAVVAGLAVLAVLVSGIWHDTMGDGAWGLRLLSCAVAGTAAVVAAELTGRYRRRAHHTARLAQDLLDALAVELTGARTVSEVAEGFMGRASERLGATSAMVFLLEEDQVLRSVTWLGRGGSEADRYAEFRLDDDLPGADAARDRTARHYPDRAAITAAFPALAGYYREERSLHLLPLVHGEDLVGLLALTFPPSVVTSEEERGLLVALSGALGASLVRARFLAGADAEWRRAAILAEASRTLSRSLDWQETLDEACRLLVPRHADWCALHLMRDGVLRTAAIRHRDPATTEWARDMQDVFPVDMDAPTGAPAVVRTGEPELHPFIPAELLEAAATSEEHRALLQRLGMVSAVIAPLGSDGTVRGAVSLAHAGSGRRFGPEDVDFLEDIASRIAVALDNAESYSRQSRRLTEVLKVAAAAQQAILSPPPHRIGPFSLSARYVSAAEEAQVGGDLYEVVTAGDRVRVLIGDVRGKGLTAVRTATIVLGGFRSVAPEAESIDEVARQLDKHVQLYLHDEEDFVTAALVEVEPDGRFGLVLCGHPAPLVAGPGGWRLLEAATTVPLGLGADPTPTRGHLDPGERMLMFTDGLLEARQGDGTFLDPEPLWALVTTEAFPSLLDTLLTALQRWTGFRLQDDLALLAIEYDPDPPRRVELVLPPDGSSVKVARGLVRDALTGTDLEGIDEDARLVVSELVTNALVHAGGEIQLVVTAGPAGLRVEVGDDSPHLPRHRDFATASMTGRGLHLADSLTTRWGSFAHGVGKVVWFEIAAPAGQRVGPVPGSPAVGEPDVADIVDVVDVELRNMPLLMHAAWQEHASALLREYLLVRLDEDPDILESHAAASDAMSLLFEQVPAPDVGGDPDAVMASALEPHVSLASMTLRVPRTSLEHFTTLRRLTRSALVLADAHELLAPPTQPEVRELGPWLCLQVADQTAGRPPEPWRLPRPEIVTAVEALLVDGWDAGEVTGSDRGLLAADESSVIVAVSPWTVEFLGYGSAADLVGRPVTLVVPTRYHQAHIAGTTLHVINGRDPLLGVAIVVPVVCADGTERSARLLVESRPLSTGRRVYLAEISDGVDDALA